MSNFSVSGDSSVKNRARDFFQNYCNLSRQQNALKSTCYTVIIDSRELKPHRLQFQGELHFTVVYLGARLSCMLIFCRSQCVDSTSTRNF